MADAPKPSNPSAALLRLKKKTSHHRSVQVRVRGVRGSLSRRKRHRTVKSSRQPLGHRSSDPTRCPCRLLDDSKLHQATLRRVADSARQSPTCADAHSPRGESVMATERHPRVKRVSHDGGCCTAETSWWPTSRKRSWQASFGLCVSTQLDGVQWLSELSALASQRSMDVLHEREVNFTEVCVSPLQCTQFHVRHTCEVCGKSCTGQMERYSCRDGCAGVSLRQKRIRILAAIDERQQRSMLKEVLEQLQKKERWKTRLVRLSKKCNNIRRKRTP